MNTSVVLITNVILPSSPLQCNGEKTLIHFSLKRLNCQFNAEPKYIGFWYLVTSVFESHQTGSNPNTHPPSSTTLWPTVIAKDCLLTLVKSRLALGSPGCSFVRLSPCQKWPNTKENGYWLAIYKAFALYEGKLCSCMIKRMMILAVLMMNICMYNIP